MYRLNEWDRSEIFEIRMANSMITYCLSLLFSTISVIIPIIVLPVVSLCILP